MTKLRVLFSLFVVLGLFLVSFGLPAERAVSAPVSAAEAASLTTMPAPILSFPGLLRTDFSADALSPDTSGAPGHTHYLQAVNENIALFRKDGRFPGEPPTSTPSGTPLFTTDFETFWAGAGTNTVCDGWAGNHHGQPYVMYDHMARRWVVVDVAYNLLNVDVGPYYLCIAVSNGVNPPAPAGLGDPTYFSPAYWYYYTLRVSDGVGDFYPDSPKLGLWPDGYYLSVDVFDVTNNGLNRTPRGAMVWALNRDDLANGITAGYRYRYFHLNEHMGYEHLVPSNLLGNPPHTGTPNLFAAIQPGKLHLWEFHVDWIDISRSSFGQANQEPNYTLNTDTSASWANGYLVPQKGTPERLDAHGERLMSPLQYRVVDGVPTIWTTHAILSGAVPVTGARWYELRQGTDDVPFLYQSGTYQPNNQYRWLSSLAVDRGGNMAIGYSESSSTMFPAIRYTGRLKSDPFGVLIPNEATLFNGTYFQDNLNSVMDGPWGRQSAMGVDPLDECIFWYTNMYYTASDPALWRTHIGWFSFPQCKGGATTRVSLHTSNTQGNLSSGVDFEMYSVATSADGRYVAFSSEASNLVNDDTNNLRDIFLRDRDTDADGIFDEPGAVQTTRVSLGMASQSNGDSWEVSLSADGRYVAFSSEASNLVANDINGTSDVFVYDRSNGQTRRVSVADVSGIGGSLRSDNPFIAGAGRYVAFTSYATNLVSAPAINTGANVFVHDMTTKRTYLISAPRTGLPAQFADSFTPTLSDNGRLVAYASEATNLVAADANGALTDVFVFNRVTGVTSLVSISTALAQGDRDSYTPYISGNGQHVAFASRATNLVLDDTNLFADIFVRDLGLNVTTLVSTNFFGLQGINGDSYSPSISRDGRYVAFASEASNLDISLADVNARRDIFLHDRGMVLDGININGLTSRISLDYLGTEPNDWSFAPVIAAGGRHVIYVSEATDLVNNDTNNVWDVFAYDSQRSLPAFLSIAGNVPGYPGDVIQVPITFLGGNLGIDTTTFSVDFDQACLSFDSADLDLDTIPDAVQFNLPSDFVRTATYAVSDVDGEIDISIYDQVAPRSTLQNSVIVTLEFTVKAACAAVPGSSNSARVGFSRDPYPSFATLGHSILGTTTDGFVRILDGRPGDCNGDGAVDAGDLSALVLEIFDGDNSDPLRTPGGTFRGNPVGCNANQDFVVDAGDLSCTILIIQGGGAAACSAGTVAVQAARPAADSPVTLSISGQTFGRSGQEVTLKVRLDAQGQPLNSLIFSLDFAEDLLAFNANDENGDGIPDAVRFNLPEGYIAAAVYDPADSDGELDFIVYSSPFGAPAALADGDFISIQFTPLPAPRLTPAGLTGALDPAASFGSPSGASLYGYVDGGPLWINPYINFTPLVSR